MARVAVVGLLLWVGCDLAFPSLCAEEFGIASSTGKTVNASNSSQQPQPVQQQDDCFCCCHHVVPAVSHVVVVHIVTADAPFALRLVASVGVTRELFRPPLYV